MISMNTIPAEKSICSTLLFNIKAMEVLHGVLLTEHFFDETCRDIYSIISEEYLNKGSMTDIAMINRLPEKEKEIIDIALMTPVSNDTLLLLASNIIKAYENRSLLKKLEEIKSAVIEGRDYSLDELRSATSSPSTRIRTNEDIIDVMENRIKNPIQDHGIGLSEVDRYLNLEPGNLIVIAARPSMGKTGLIITTMWHLLDNGEGSLFFSLEMPSEAIMMRMLSNKSGETLSDIRHNKLVSYTAYNDARNILTNTRDFIIIDEVLDHIQIYNIAMSVIKKNPAIKNIFIDHLTYIKDPGGYGNNHLRISDITKTMKRLAKEARVKVWLLSQLSRGVESRPNKRPQLSDMRESGSIEEDADVILGIYRDSYYTSRQEAKREDPINEVEILVLKNRDGEVGGAKTMFVGPKVKFTDKAEGFIGAVQVSEYEYAEDIQVSQNGEALSYFDDISPVSMPTI